MTRILIVRTSSLGDIIQSLPAISDIYLNVPNARIDWLIEKKFHKIPILHFGINKVIKISQRKWRKKKLNKNFRLEINSFYKKVFFESYNIIIDFQSLVKSTLISKNIKGNRHGLSWKSSVESVSSIFLDKNYFIEFWKPAIFRQRLLIGKILGYEIKNKLTFGLNLNQRISNINENYVSIMPSASGNRKFWSNNNWKKIISFLNNVNLRIKIFSGNNIEIYRAKKIIKNQINSELLPVMSINKVLKVLINSKIMIGLDSGLTHLSASLGISTICLYNCSSPVRNPVIGNGINFNLGDFGNFSSINQILNAIKYILTNSY